MWCGIYFSWTAAADDDEMKEKRNKKHKKGWRVKGRARGVAGCRAMEEEKRHVCQKEER